MIEPTTSLSVLEALLLGIVQGLTEFLPVSSSGHLELAQAMMGNANLSQQNLIFTIVVHAATALATLVVFRKDVFEIIGGLIKFQNNEATRFSLLIVISMIPAVGVGLFFEETIAQFFFGNTLLVGAMLWVTAALLFVADRPFSNHQPITPKTAALVGIAQAFAILPGISRSGATIACSLLLKVDRPKAARFSFLMVVPLILGSMAKTLWSGDLSQSHDQMELLPFVVGFVAAFVSGYLACTWMIALVKRSKLKYFAYYCATVGTLALIAQWV
ncbi:MAG: undecaprenyl-diphosphate phosphatase [Flavobacteriaceae bacterium]